MILSCHEKTQFSKTRRSDLGLLYWNRTKFLKAYMSRKPTPSLIYANTVTAKASAVCSVHVGGVLWFNPGGSRQQIRQCFSSEVSASSLLSWPSPPTSYFFIYNSCGQPPSPHTEKHMLRTTAFLCVIFRRRFSSTVQNKVGLEVGRLRSVADSHPIQWGVKTVGGFRR